VALISFEALRRRIPVLSAYSIAALLTMNELIVPTGNAALVNAFYLAWTIPLAAVMALSLYAPERFEAITRRAQRRLSPAT
jgi:hypothetical protein